MRTWVVGSLVTSAVVATACSGSSGDQIGGGSPSTGSDAAADTPTADGGAACPAGKASCGGACVDLASDADNCGACGVRCCGPCAQGKCPDAQAPVTLASEPNWTVDSMVSDGHTVYFNGTSVDYTTDAIMSVPRAGGSVTTIADAQVGARGNVALAAGRLYWVIQGDGTLLSAPTSNGPPEVLAKLTNASDGSDAIAVYDGTLYFGTWHGELGSIALDGTKLTQLSSTPDGSSVDGIAADASYVYFKSPHGLYRAPRLQGGGADTVMSAEPFSFGVAGDGLYFIDATGLATIPRTATGNPTPTAISMGDEPITLALDASNVYWLDGGDQQALMKAALPHGAPAALASYAAPSQGHSYTITVDQSCVYWAQGTNIYTMPK
jgi:hypothetical protein